jgi:hypothetical protein
MCGKTRPMRILLALAISMVCMWSVGLAAAPGLAQRAEQLPDVKPDLTAPMVESALRHGTDKIPAALIVALAWGESRFQLDAKPRCGVMQVWPADIDRPASDCEVWRRDLDAGVMAGVEEIRMLLADSRVAGDMRRALLYRACGNVAFDGTCDGKKIRWVNEAISRWHWLAGMDPNT